MPNDAAPDPVRPDRLSTESRGKPADAVDGWSESARPADPVKAALTGAQRISRSRPGSRRKRAERDQPGRSQRGGYSSAAPDTTDPQPVGSIVADYLADRGWEQPLAEARVFTDWAAIVGADVAAHCAPATLRNGQLQVSAESTAWATQLRLLAGTLLTRIRAELGPDVVHKVVISGPVAPSWKHGPRSVAGARGPRDTYG